MTPEIKFFIESLKKNPLAIYYANNMFSSMPEDKGRLFSQAIQENTRRYSDVADVQSCPDVDESEQKLFQAVFELFPSFGLLLARDIFERGKDHKLAKQALITWMLGYMLDQKEFESKELQFLKHYQADFSKEQCVAALDLGETAPKTIINATYRDFVQIVKQPFPFKPSKDFRQQIEDLFCFTGLTQIFLRYFFDLICQSPSDVVTLHIENVFSKLFIILRLSEISYWKKIGNVEVVKRRLLQMVDLNIKNKRHPVLQKAAFANLNGYHPIVHDGKSRGLTKTAHQTLQKQLDSLKSMNVPATVILVNTVLKTKGVDYLVYLLTQIMKLDKGKTYKLHEFICDASDRQYDTLEKILTSFIKRFQPSKKTVSRKIEKVKPKLVLSENTSRLSTAKKNLEKIKNTKGMMTHDQVTSYLEERLKKLYERVKKTGALTQDKIPEYLAQFATISEPILEEVISEARQEELVKAFEESTAEILSIMAEQDNLSESEVAEFKVEIKEQIDELASPDLEKRTDAVEKIGISLTEASEKAEKKDKPIDYTKMLNDETIYIGFNKMAQPMPMLEFLTLPLGERKGPPENNWFEQHKLYLELSVNKDKLKQSVVDTVKAAIPGLETPSYRKYFNVFPGGEYEETVICAIFDIWKSKALDNLRVN